MKPKGLVNPDQRIANYITLYRAAHDHGPTFDEIAAYLGIVRSSAFYHVYRMLREGKLSRTPGIARSLRVTDVGTDDLGDLEPGALLDSLEAWTAKVWLGDKDDHASREKAEELRAEVLRRLTSY